MVSAAIKDSDRLKMFDKFNELCIWISFSSNLLASFISPYFNNSELTRTSCHRRTIVME